MGVMRSALMTIGVVNHNTCDSLRLCLESATAQPAEIIVLDNASTDGSAEMVQRCFPSVTLLANRNNTGYGAGANQILRSTDTEYLLILNSDTLLKQGAVEALCAYLDEHPRAAVLGPRLTFPNGRLQRSCRRFPGTFEWLLDNLILGKVIPALGLFRTWFLNGWKHDRPRVVP